MPVTPDTIQTGRRAASYSAVKSVIYSQMTFFPQQRGYDADPEHATVVLWRNAIVIGYPSDSSSLRLTASEAKYTLITVSLPQDLKRPSAALVGRGLKP